MKVNLNTKMINLTIKRIYLLFLIFLFIIHFAYQPIEPFLYIMFLLTVFWISSIFITIFIYQMDDKKYNIFKSNLNLHLLLSIIISILILITKNRNKTKGIILAITGELESARYDGLSLYGLLKLVEVIHYFLWVFNPVAIISFIFIYILIYLKTKKIIFSYHVPLLLIILLDMEAIFYFFRYKSLTFLSF